MLLCVLHASSLQCSALQVGLVISEGVHCVSAASCNPQGSILANKKRVLIAVIIAILVGVAVVVVLVIILGAAIGCSVNNCGRR